MMYGTDKSYMRPVLSIVITIRSWSRSTSTSFLVICTKNTNIYTLSTRNKILIILPL